MVGQDETSISLLYFAIFSSDGKMMTPLLSMSPLLDSDSSNNDDSLEVSHDARENQLYLRNILSNYGRSLEDVAFLVCDNCGVNRRVSKNLGVPMIGCASRRLDLAVKKYIEKSWNIGRLPKPSQTHFATSRP